jgi:pimeloyl-ACP methyl ester carboxylesterase
MRRTLTSDHGARKQLGRSVPVTAGARYWVEVIRSRLESAVRLPGAIRRGGGRAARSVLGRMLFMPSREILQTPAEAGLTSIDLAIATDDGERLHGWWISAASAPLGHILFCHGNGGNVGDRVVNAGVLSAAGFDVLLLDYRGYGRSSGHPDEAGTYRDARAGRAMLLAQAGVDPGRVFYLGESLGGAVALKLAIESPPAGLILQSTFTSVRAVARTHYPRIPVALIPDVYPSLTVIRELTAPLLVLHGDDDEIVPVEQGRALYAAAPGPKRIDVFPGYGHNDLVMAGPAYTSAVVEWATAPGAIPPAHAFPERQL